jgi:antitoxin component of MazEF toxin-antitoxin module
MEVFHTRIEADGKIQLPPQVLEELDFEAGEDIELEIEKRTLRVSSTKLKQRREAQEFIKSRIEKNNSVVEEFIEERRQEALDD